MDRRAPNVKLFKAADINISNQVRAALEDGANPSINGEGGLTPLFSPLQT
jgi:hypothetical protein